MLEILSSTSIGLENGKELLDSFLKDKEIVSAFWISASKNKVQFRAVSEMRSLLVFLSPHLDDDLLPVPKGLRDCMNVLGHREASDKRDEF